MRIIMHLDLDAFYASVEVREDPSLAGKPIVIGADPKQGKGRGVISTCSYEARKYGLRSGMPISIAWRMCPSPPCIYLPVNMPLYVKVSQDVFSIVRRYADRFEQGGIDEAYLDVSGRCKNFDEAAKLARKIQQEVKEKEKLTCSVGIGPNKLVAKIASDFRKPEGLTVVGPAAVARFMSRLPVRKLPGVGPKTEARLRELGIETIGQLRKQPKFVLIERFGKAFGAYLYQACRGIDESPIVESWEPRSISREYTFEKDTRDTALMHKVIEEMAKGVHEQLMAEKKKYRTVTLKVRYQGFETHTSQKTLKEYTDSLDAIADIAKELLKPYLEKSDRKVRLLGVRVSKLEEGKE